MLNAKSGVKDLVRILLAFVIVYYLPVSLVITRQKTENISSNIIMAPENSMGGRESALSVENVSLGSFNMEESLPEPEEFSRPRMVIYTSYTVKPADNLSGIAKQFGLNAGTLISVNDMKWTGSSAVGKVLKIPNQDGVTYKIGKNDTLDSISKKYKTSADAVKTANELFSSTINVNSSLFLPGGSIPWEDLQEINGDLFLWPVRGYISSYYGYRRSPFTGTRTFHGGLDIAAPMNTPVKAAMAGRVSAVGYDDVYGNFAVITHQSGYRTLYGHMSLVRARTGTYVNAGDQIGDVGNTGQSTGPHVHFTVYKNGATINPRAVLR